MLDTFWKEKNNLLNKCGDIECIQYLSVCMSVFFW